MPTARVCFTSALRVPSRSTLILFGHRVQTARSCRASTLRTPEPGYRAHQHCELPASPCWRPSDTECRLPGLATHRHSVCRLPGCFISAVRVASKSTSKAFGHRVQIARICSASTDADCPRMLHISIASCQQVNAEGLRTASAGCPEWAFGRPVRAARTCSASTPLCRKPGYRAHQHCEFPASHRWRPSDIECRLPGLAVHRHSVCRLTGCASFQQCGFPARRRRRPSGIECRLTGLAAHPSS